MLDRDDHLFVYGSICNYTDAIFENEQRNVPIHSYWFAHSGKCLTAAYFHYVEGYVLDKIRPLNDLITDGIIVVDFCIDQPADFSKSPHDRGPHIRVPKSKLNRAYEEIKRIL